MSLIDMNAVEENKRYKSIIESLLFVWGEPLSIGKISKILEIKPSTVEQIIIEMKAQYLQENRGIQIVEVNKQFQFSTLKENYPFIEKLCKQSRSKGLTNSALEVLAIVAYKQPITKLDIEQVRGVNCDSALQSLMERELIEVKGKLEKIGRPQIYGTTDVFLKSFGFKTLAELPKIDGLDAMKKFMEAPSNDSD